MKRLGCIYSYCYTEYLSDTLVLQPKLSLKTRFPARFNSHVTSHVTDPQDRRVTYSRTYSAV